MGFDALKVCFVSVLLYLAVILPTQAQEISSTVSRMESRGDAEFKKGSPRVVRGPDGGKTLRFDKPMKCRIDLRAQGVDPHKCDLIKLQVKADRGAVMKLALENYPKVGDISYWWVLDSMRGAFDWKTIWVDLKIPEEIKKGGQRKNRWRKGMGKGTEKHRGLQISASIKDLGTDRQGPHKRIWLGDVRFVKEAVHLDWDQTKAPHQWGEGEPLVFTYPLTLTNRLNKTVTAELRLEPFEVTHAKAVPEQKSVKLAGGQTRTIPVKISLPPAVAARKEPLYCERFLPLASVQGIADSTVTVLRSSDPIHLAVTVPIEQKKLGFPFFPRPSELPNSVTRFSKSMAEKNAARDPKELIRNALQHGLYQYGKDRHNVTQFRKTFIASAWLYDLTGDQKYLSTATSLAKALPDIWEKWYEQYQSKSVRVISNGVVTRWNDGNHYTLSLGWLVMGTQRSPYYYGTSGNGAGGSMSALAYAFDIISPKLKRDQRQEIIEGFFLPAGIQARNHYIGDGNQQATANVMALYAGLAARNWPLVSFAVSSEHGYHGILKWCFDDDGVQIRKNYQTYTMRPMLWASELLYGCGLNFYEKHRKRYHQIVHADTRAKGKGGPFQDGYFWEFVRKKRIE
ncbi:MAG: hypothetical protein ACLFWL_05895 [Candidatus Brocadiia bacterium]